MTVQYDCSVNFSDYEEGLDMNLVSQAKFALEKDGYNIYDTEDGFEVSGEIEIDDYGTDAIDVADEIKHLLWSIADIDADVDAKASSSEPDWDYIYGF